MSAAEQVCHQKYHAYSTVQRIDVHYTGTSWEPCALFPCPSRNDRRAAAKVLPEGCELISRHQEPPRASSASARAPSCTASRAPSCAPSRATSPTRQPKGKEPAGPSVAWTPETETVHLPEETPRPTRIMTSQAEPAPAITDYEEEGDAKVAKPPQYSGSPETFRTWWVQMRNYIALQPKKFRTDQQKVGTVLSYM